MHNIYVTLILPLTVTVYNNKIHLCKTWASKSLWQDTSDSESHKHNNEFQEIKD